MVGTGGTLQKGSNRVRPGPKGMEFLERKAFLHFRMASEREFCYIFLTFFFKKTRKIFDKKKTIDNPLHLPIVSVYFPLASVYIP